TTGAPRKEPENPRRHAGTSSAAAAMSATTVHLRALTVRRNPSVSIRPMPTSREMYLRRLETVRERLRVIPADGLYATPSSNLYSPTGIDFHRSERLTALLLFPDADPVIVCPAFEERRLRGMSAVSKVVTWEETDDPFAKAAALFPASSGTLAV